MVTTNGVATGASSFLATIAWRTNPRARTYTALVQIKVVSAVGTVAGLSDIINAHCASSGRAAGPTSAAGQAWSGKITFTNSVGKGRRHVSNALFVSTPVLASGGSSSAGGGRSSTTVRCDDELGSQRPGCVLNAVTPTVSMAGLPKIAKNIRGIQTRGGYGVPGDHQRALHRITRKASITGNRRAVCARKITGPPPKPKMSCDEYPFASTKEGGTALSGMHRGWAWVPIGEQSSQGGILSSFYQDQRVLNDDAFWVKV
ncbi:NucA/NucB deoxyribonuclease domain-containing protein [Spirillospora sp. CA-294931]|uniref:NucA/NucB deoxyribonuclease domain-containing protein n=1 Tax=Spirillospora sp. CA-294931 TaxID=3240042 RepID=UPI003D8DDA5A